MMVQVHLPSLLHAGGQRNDLMVWLGDIRILLEVEAVVVVVNYRGIRVCLEEVDQMILGGSGKCSKDQKPGIAIYCILISLRKSLRQ